MSGLQIQVGTTSLDLVQVREFMERQSARYNGDTYHLIVKNCNHFSKDICHSQAHWEINSNIDKSTFSTRFNLQLRISYGKHDPNYRAHDSENRRLRSAFNCLPSISIRQKHLSTSSLFLQSPLRGC